MRPETMHDHQYREHKTPDPTLLELILRVHGDFRWRLQPIGVTPLQAGVLSYLSQHAGARLMDAATALRVKSPTLMEVVQDLHRKGWVTKRHPIGDGRALALYLTPKGKALARTIAPLVRNVEELLSMDERDALGMTNKDPSA